MFEKQFDYKKNNGIIHFNLANFCSISFGGERNGTQRKAADVPAWLKINCVPLKALKCTLYDIVDNILIDVALYLNKLLSLFYNDMLYGKTS